MSALVRLASPTDAAAVAGIYAPIVLHTATSFETEPPDAGAFEQRIATTLDAHPWLVYAHSGSVAGYAYAGAHRSRPAYRWSVETSVYVAADAQRQGIARALYTSLLALLRVQGYVSAYAGITLPNAPSEAFHRAMGFAPVGVYRRAGFKLGAWHDTAWSQYALRGGDAPPGPIRTPAALADDPDWQTAMQAGMR